MNIEIINQEKDLIELKMDNITVAEVLRVYLNNSGIKFAAWRREHPVKPIVFRIEDSNVKKAVSDAVSAIRKDADKIVKAVK
ncbi:hypothetical protein COU62_04815 [Candidatus Pacearchaeota archaeon CG10_big_fil_rev_8_21_14_0_10_35_219]|nr:hypothetical protein [Candidatus Pacearchaeota archaeon]OIO42886.1 MAG: hypothetical protein AUJ63_01590 [Candidatus Pacearchaeota archaeon CG1_02_35_32]PIO07123.1 MAG: hypothetical protein COU62_04815 [Candidatus Pacearchaeota archaeon CG10_big_fil_rev_8_21_14_0_10_35_219]PIY81666.1 MAG: hypothetical protein COY79_01590 [Candidatus Pacearchaeota archaeon CG_4_10_14_0_8_um_filter_35_169]PIZ80917.1 MAG: hypothetical protein COY00_00165 [Candidatus Pacearchaeota archaeon CG_4_10_14_0_2_um_filt